MNEFKLEVILNDPETKKEFEELVKTSITIQKNLKTVEKLFLEQSVDTNLENVEPRHIKIKEISNENEFLIMKLRMGGTKKLEKMFIAKDLVKYNEEEIKEYILDNCF